MKEAIITTNSKLANTIKNSEEIQQRGMEVRVSHKEKYSTAAIKYEDDSDLFFAAYFLGYKRGTTINR